MDRPVAPLLARQGLRHVPLLGLLFLAADAAKHRELRQRALDPVEAPPGSLDPGEAPAMESLGPGGCVSLSRSAEGTCVIDTDCSANISETEFAFVCFNPGSSVPHALHSFGRGGFAQKESFDTGVSCGSCTSVEYALSAGGPLLSAKSAATGGFSPLRSDEGASNFAAGEGNASTEGEISRGSAVSAAARRVQTAFYGPSACIATYLSDRGTCMIETRCSGIAGLPEFTVGLTCLDQTGDYTRYLFGKDSFQPEEVFDSTLRCQACLGVGDEPVQQLRTLVPKLLVEDVGMLKEEVRTLRQEVRLLRLSYASRIAGNVTNTSNATNATSNLTSGGGGEDSVATAANITQATPEPFEETTPEPVEETTPEQLAPAPSLARAPAPSLPAHAEEAIQLAPAPSLASAPAQSLPSAALAASLAAAPTAYSGATDLALARLGLPRRTHARAEVVPQAGESLSPVAAAPPAAATASLRAARHQPQAGLTVKDLLRRLGSQH
mmetsp:Transcript_49494/g.105816  ORF Transcript_49494/g.105816 Transcript_49494/m.105816 type:complete len:496 (+) Transcript_49494:205-1692(+)